MSEGIGFSRGQSKDHNLRPGRKTEIFSPDVKRVKSKIYVPEVNHWNLQFGSKM